MPNSTVTSTATIIHNSTTTVTFTGTVTSTINHTVLQSIPWQFYLIGLLILAGGVLAYVFFRLNVKEIPAVVEFLGTNYHAWEIRAKKDINGIYLKLYRGSKHVESLKAVTKPFEVTVLDPKVKGYIVSKRLMDDDTRKLLTDRGFTITDRDKDRKGRVKSYLLEEPPNGKALAYFPTHLGGMKTVLRYMTVEGTGKTIDPMEVVGATLNGGNNKSEEDTTGLVHELVSAGKEIIGLINEGAQGNFKMLLGVAAGLPMGMALIMVALEFTGHLR